MNSFFSFATAATLALSEAVSVAFCKLKWHSCEVYSHRYSGRSRIACSNHPTPLHCFPAQVPPQASSLQHTPNCIHNFKTINILKLNGARLDFLLISACGGFKHMGLIYTPSHKSRHWCCQSHTEKYEFPKILCIRAILLRLQEELDNRCFNCLFSPGSPNVIIQSISGGQQLIFPPVLHMCLDRMC